MLACCCWAGTTGCLSLWKLRLICPNDEVKDEVKADLPNSTTLSNVDFAEFSVVFAYPNKAPAAVLMVGMS